MLLFWECPMFIYYFVMCQSKQLIAKEKKILGATTPKLINTIDTKKSNHLNTHNKDTYIFIAECLGAFRYPSKYIQYNYLHEDTQVFLQVTKFFYLHLNTPLESKDTRCIHGWKRSPPTIHMQTVKGKKKHCNTFLSSGRLDPNTHSLIFLGPTTLKVGGGPWDQTFPYKIIKHLHSAQ